MIATKIKINEVIYSKEIVLKTIEILSSRFYCELNKNKSYFLLSILEKFSLGLSEEDLVNIVFDHLNNQIIRNKIFNETKDIRNLIIGKALFETEAFDEQSNYFDISKYEDKDNYILDEKEISNN